MIVVGEVGAGAGSTGGVEEFFPFVFAIMDLDVTWVKFGQVFE